MRKSKSTLKNTSKTPSKIDSTKKTSEYPPTSEQDERPALCGFAYGQMEQMKKQNSFDLNQITSSSLSLFSIFNLANIFNEQKQYSTMSKAHKLFLLASFISSLGIIFSKAAEIFFGTFKFNLESNLIDASKAPLDFSPLVGVSLYMILFYLPLSLIANLVCEEILYKLFTISGGIGGKKEQFYLSSLVLLALSFSTFVLLLSQIPVFDFVAIFLFLLLFFYVLFYLFEKMYSNVHRIHFFHALVLNIIIRGTTMTLVIIIANFVSAALGLPRFLA